MVSANDRCDKCGTHISKWRDTPCVRSLTQSPRHTITRFHLLPEAQSGKPDVRAEKP